MPKFIEDLGNNGYAVEEVVITIYGVAKIALKKTLAK